MKRVTEYYERSRPESLKKEEKVFQEDDMLKCFLVHSPITKKCKCYGFIEYEMKKSSLNARNNEPNADDDDFSGFRNQEYQKYYLKNKFGGEETGAGDLTIEWITTKSLTRYEDLQTTVIAIQFPNYEFLNWETAEILDENHFEYSSQKIWKKITTELKCIYNSAKDEQKIYTKMKETTESAGSDSHVSAFKNNLKIPVILEYETWQDAEEAYDLVVEKFDWSIKYFFSSTKSNAGRVAFKSKHKDVESRINKLEVRSHRSSMSNNLSGMDQNSSTGFDSNQTPTRGYLGQLSLSSVANQTPTPAYHQQNSLRIFAFK